MEYHLNIEEYNDFNFDQVPPSEDMLTCVDVPDVGCIHFHPIKAHSNKNTSHGGGDAIFPLGDLPVTFELDDIQTNFVSVGIFPPYLIIFMNLFFWILEFLLTRIYSLLRFCRQVFL